MSDITAPEKGACSGHAPDVKLSDNVLLGLVSGGFFHGIHYGSMAVMGLATGGLAAATLPLSVAFGGAAYAGWYALAGHKTSRTNRIKAAVVQAGVGAAMYVGASYGLPHEIDSTSLTRDFVEQAATEAGISMEEYLKTHVCLSDQGLEEFYTTWDRDPRTPGFQ